MTIAPSASVNDRPHRVTLQNPGPPVADGHGGFTQSWTDLVPPAVSAKIAPATATDLERVTAGTVIATATHVVTMPYHPQVTTLTRVLFNGRQFSVTGVSDPEERHVETIAICKEIVH
jgi:SPP1 family predicted phage head-tail adaptor